MKQLRPRKIIRISTAVVARFQGFFAALERGSPTLDMRGWSGNKGTDRAVEGPLDAWWRVLIGPTNIEIALALSPKNFRSKPHTMLHHSNGSTAAIGSILGHLRFGLDLQIIGRLASTMKGRLPL